MSNPIQHGGAWWDRRPDGSLAVYDDAAKEWKDWDAARHGQPPPQLGGPAYTTQPEKKKTSILAILVVLVLLFAVCSYIGSSLDDISDEGPTSTFTAEVTNYRPANPASIQVFVITTNTGEETATPTCNVEASDPSGAYSGFDGFELDPIAPGAHQRWNGFVTIENEGAQFVTDVKVKC